jgi:methionyl-tRNA formyltransferase
MRVAFFGSPGFAATALESLSQRHEVCLVVTQPDKPVGRGLKLSSPPAAITAKELGLPLAQPTRLKGNSTFAEQLHALQPEVAITAAYGKILPQALLGIPQHGFLNIHASLLPKYRGAAPIQWALINGETTTGITIMQTEAGLDTGPIRHVKRLDIAPQDTALTLFDTLATLGTEAILEALELLNKNQLPSTPQDDSQASYAPLLTKDDGRIRWEDSASQIINRFRGVIAWPGSWTTFRGTSLKVHQLRLTQTSGKPGTILDSGAGVTVACGNGAIQLTEVQPASRPRMTALDWVNGYQVKVGEHFG